MLSSLWMLNLFRQSTEIKERKRELINKNEVSGDKSQTSSYIRIFAAFEICHIVSADVPTLTCSVLSNQRFPLFQRAPPPCSICAATRLWYISSDTRGMGASKQTVKMLFWMARTDSLFVLSEGPICLSRKRFRQLKSAFGCVLCPPLIRLL